MDFEKRWLEEKFVNVSVALAVTIVNESKDWILTHADTLFVDGWGDPLYYVPMVIPPKVELCKHLQNFEVNRSTVRSEK